MSKLVNSKIQVRNGPLSLHEMVEAVNLIADTLAKQTKAKVTRDSGLLHIHLSGKFDILVRAMDTACIRGFSQSRAYTLAKEIQAPAIIQLQIVVGPIHGPTSIEYLLPGRGDCPVTLFLNTMAEILGHDGVKKLKP